MGIQESKVVIDTLSEAHYMAVRNGKKQIEVKLEKNFLKALRGLWCRLTESQRKSIARNATSQKRKSPKQRETVTSLDHEKLMENVERWSLSTSSLDFFAENGSRLVMTRNALKDITEYMKKLENTNGYNSVRLRLLQAICHRCKEKLAVKNLSNSGVQRLTHIISQSGIVDPNSSKKIIDWVDKGNRIQDICREVGFNNTPGSRHLANLFFCDGVFDTTIARLPLQKNSDKAKDGALRNDLIKRIRNCSDQLGLEKRQKLEDFTHSLFEGIWNGVEKVIHSTRWEKQNIMSFQQSPHIAIPSPSTSPSRTHSPSSASPPVPSPSVNLQYSREPLSPGRDSIDIENMDLDFPVDRTPLPTNSSAPNRSNWHDPPSTHMPPGPSISAPPACVSPVADCQLLDMSGMTFDTPWNDTLQAVGYQHLNMIDMTFDTPWDGPSAGQQIDGLASSVETSTIFTENLSSAPIATAPRTNDQPIPIEIAPLDLRWNGHLVAPSNPGTPLPSGYQLLDMAHVAFDTPWNGPPAGSLDFQIYPPAAEAPSTSFTWQ